MKFVDYYMINEGNISDIFDKLKKYIKYIPNISDIINDISNKDPKDIILYIIKKIGVPDEQTIKDAIKLKNIITPNSVAEATIFDNFKNIKNTVMTMILLSVMAGLTNSTMAQSKTDMEKQYVEIFDTSIAYSKQVDNINKSLSKVITPLQQKIELIKNDVNVDVNTLNDIKDSIMDNNISKLSKILTVNGASVKVNVGVGTVDVKFNTGISDTIKKFVNEKMSNINREEVVNTFSAAIADSYKNNKETMKELLKLKKLDTLAAKKFGPDYKKTDIQKSIYNLVKKQLDK